MFGLWESGNVNLWTGRRAVERRVLCFGPETDDIGEELYLRGMLEIKVYRSKGRRRLRAGDAGRLSEHDRLKMQDGIK